MEPPRPHAQATQSPSDWSLLYETKPTQHSLSFTSAESVRGHFTGLVLCAFLVRLVAGCLPFPFLLWACCSFSLPFLLSALLFPLPFWPAPLTFSVALLLSFSSFPPSLSSSSLLSMLLLAFFSLSHSTSPKPWHSSVNELVEVLPFLQKEWQLEEGSKLEICVLLWTEALVPGVDMSIGIPVSGVTSEKCWVSDTPGDAIVSAGLVHLGIPWSRATCEIDWPSSTALRAAVMDSSGQPLHVLGLFGLAR